MIKNFEEVKKLLAELSEVVNKFKSEAVQLRIVELVFTGGTLPDADPAMLHDGAYRLFLVEESLRHHAPSREVAPASSVSTINRNRSSLCSYGTSCLWNGYTSIRFSAVTWL